MLDQILESSIPHPILIAGPANSGKTVLRDRIASLTPPEHKDKPIIVGQSPYLSDYGLSRQIVLSQNYYAFYLDRYSLKVLNHLSLPNSRNLRKAAIARLVEDKRFCLAVNQRSVEILDI